MHFRHISTKLSQNLETSFRLGGGARALLATPLVAVVLPWRYDAGIGIAKSLNAST